MELNYTHDIYDHPLISEKYFFPRITSLENPYLVESQGNTLACYYHRVEGASYTVVHFHGNAEVCADYVNSALNTLPCNILYVEYAGFGASSKARPKLLSMLKDIDAVVASLAVPVEKLIFFGRSVGSIYAVNAAACYPNAAGLVVESGVSDVLQRIILRVFPEEVGVSWYAMEHYARLYFNQQTKLQYFKGKTLILHSQHDSVVDVSHARQLYTWANEPKTLHIFKQGNHNSILSVNQKAYLDTVMKFLEDLD